MRNCDHCTVAAISLLVLFLPSVGDPNTIKNVCYKSYIRLALVGKTVTVVQHNGVILVLNKNGYCLKQKVAVTIVTGNLSKFSDKFGRKRLCNCIYYLLIYYLYYYKAPVTLTLSVCHVIDVEGELYIQQNTL